MIPLRDPVDGIHFLLLYFNSLGRWAIATESGVSRVQPRMKTFGQFPTYPSGLFPRIGWTMEPRLAFEVLVVRVEDSASCGIDPCSMNSVRILSFLGLSHKCQIDSHPNRCTVSVV
jgi:hypothetical protein